MINSLPPLPRGQRKLDAVLNQHLAWAAVGLGGLLVLLILVCYWKGEKPRWSWGKD